jgi:hypothetical protein
LVSCAARTAILEERTVGISARSSGGEDIRERLEEILGVLDLEEGLVMVVDSAPNSPRKVTVDRFPHPYIPTKTRWAGGEAGRACCQLLNGQTPGYVANKRDMKPLEAWHREEIEAWLDAEFDEVVRLGKDRTIAECVEVAARSELFIGMDSGMSHLCHSVGVPVLIKDWSGLDRHHPKKEFLRFRDPAEAIAMMERIQGHG